MDAPPPLLMDDIFKQLQDAGRNNVENLIKWLKDSNIIDADEESRAFQLFESTETPDNVPLERFKEIVEELGTQLVANLEELVENQPEMEEVFTKLQKEGKNDIDHLVKWLKDTKVIDATKEQEAKVRELFKDADPKNIPLEKFKEVVKKLAEDCKKNVEGITKQLGEAGPKFMQSAMDAAKGAASSLKDAFKKKDK